MFVFMLFFPFVAVVNAAHNPPRFAVQNYNSTTKFPLLTNNPIIRNRKVVGTLSMLTALYAATRPPRDDPPRLPQLYSPAYELTGETSVMKNAKAILCISSWATVCFCMLILKSL